MNLEDFPISATPAPAPRWVPIRSLTRRNAHRIRTHLKALDERDRGLRFGQAVTDEQIDRYVDGLDFDQDELFGIFDRRLALVGMAHLAYLRPPPEDARPLVAEFGVSVSARVRGRGMGAQLFDHAVLHARNRGVRALLIHALSENRPMLRIAAAAGATIERHGSDAQALLMLPPDDIGSHMDEWVATCKAALDYAYKRRVQGLDGLLGAIGTIGAAGLRGTSRDPAPTPRLGRGKHTQAWGPWRGARR